MSKQTTGKTITRTFDADTPLSADEHGLLVRLPYSITVRGGGKFGAATSLDQ